MLSFKVKEDDTINDLQLKLQAETKIPVAEQELLLDTGLSPDPRKPARMYAADLVLTLVFTIVFISTKLAYGNIKVKQKTSLVMKSRIFSFLDGGRRMVGVFIQEGKC